MSLYVRWPFGLSRSQAIVGFAMAVDTTEAHAAGMFMELCSAIAITGSAGTLDGISDSALCQIMQWDGSAKTDSEPTTDEQFVEAVRSMLIGPDGRLFMWDLVAGGVPVIAPTDHRIDSEDAADEVRRPMTGAERQKLWRRRHSRTAAHRNGSNGNSHDDSNVSSNESDVTRVTKERKKELVNARSDRTKSGTTNDLVVSQDHDRDATAVTNRNDNRDVIDNAKSDEASRNAGVTDRHADRLAAERGFKLVRSALGAATKGQAE